VQRVRLGATADGRLTAIGHAAWQRCARFDNFCEPIVMATRTLYAAPNRLTTHRLVKLDLPVADSTRDPGEAVGLLALEKAMDELAEKLGLDPVELRLRNEPALDPEKQVPYSSRQLVACLQQGAAFRVVRPQGLAGADAAGPLAHRHGHGSVHPRQPAASPWTSRYC